MTNGVICVALERDVWIGSLHPHIERIMQNRFAKKWDLDNPALRSSCCSQHDAAVLHVHRRSIQPALRCSSGARGWLSMTTDRPITPRPEHQLPIDAVKIGFYVRSQHPVVAPTALTSLAHGVDRRFAGSVAIGVGMKHRLETRPVSGSAAASWRPVSNRWNAQRARTTAIHPSCRTHRTGGGRVALCTTAGSRARRGCSKNLASKCAIDCPST